MSFPLRQMVYWTAWLALLVFVSEVRAEEFRSEPGRFRFQIPQNWMRLDAAKRAQVQNEMARQPNSRNSVFHEGFEPRNLQQGGIILVIEERSKIGPFETYDSIDAALQREFRRGFVAGAGPNVNLGPVALDRARNRFVATLDTRQNGIKIQGVLYGFLGKNGIVMILGMADEGQFAQQRPTFDASANSFQFDPGFEFVPMDPTVFLWILGGVFASLCFALVLVAIVIIVIVMIVTRSR